jgi:hypothetical protein
MDLSTEPLPGDDSTSRLEESRAWTHSVTPRFPGRFTLTLRGHLQAGWAARLASGLAARKVSVVRARAHREPASRVWSAEIDVITPLELVLDEPALETLLKDRVPLDGKASAPAVTRYVLTPNLEDLEVQLRAPDSVGFLDRVLRLFAFYGLFPCELGIDTVRGEVRDVFRLRTMTGEAPSARTREALERRLASLAAA